MISILRKDPTHSSLRDLIVGSLVCQSKTNPPPPPNPTNPNTCTHHHSQYTRLLCVLINSKATELQLYAYSGDEDWRKLPVTPLFLILLRCLPAAWRCRRLSTWCWIKKGATLVQKIRSFENQQGFAGHEKMPSPSKLIFMLKTSGWCWKSSWQLLSPAQKLNHFPQT